MIQPPYTDESLMPFGKYKGQALANVPAHYLLWCYENIDLRDPLKTYIVSNLDVIKDEVKKRQQKKNAKR
jgi:hypothetical protein